LRYDGLLAGLEALRTTLSGCMGTLKSDLSGDDRISGSAKTAGRGDGAMVLEELVPKEAEENIVIAGEMLGSRAF